LLAQLARAVGGGVGLGREAGDGLEQAVEVVCAQARFLRQRIERGRCIRSLDAAARGGHQRGLLGTRGGLVGAGAAARAIACRFSVGGRVEELDVLRARQARRAARLAVHAGGLHRVDKLAVGGGIAREHAGPARVVFDGGDHDGGRCGLGRRLHGVIQWKSMPVL
jgi:hypothetical protein